MLLFLLLLLNRAFPRCSPDQLFELEDCSLDARLSIGVVVLDAVVLIIVIKSRFP